MHKKGKLSQILIQRKACGLMSLMGNSGISLTNCKSSTNLNETNTIFQSKGRLTIATTGSG